MNSTQPYAFPVAPGLCKDRETILRHGVWAIATCNLYWCTVVSDCSNFDFLVCCEVVLSLQLKTSRQFCVV